MSNNGLYPESVELIVLDDEAARRYAHELLDAGLPVAVVARTASLVVPFLEAGGQTVAVVADIDDPDQLAGAIMRVESRLAPVGALIRYRCDVPVHPTAFHAA